MRRKIEEMQRVAEALGEELVGRPVPRLGGRFDRLADEPRAEIPDGLEGEVLPRFVRHVEGYEAE